MNALRAVAWIVAFGLLAGACGGSTPAETLPSPTSSVSFPSDRVTVRFGSGVQVRAEVAVTVAQLGRGLMYRTELGTDDGMLFLLPGQRSDGFYMKNTLIPLSIAYLRRTSDGTYRVVAILDMQPCPASTAECPTYPPGARYDAALEVNQGWFKRNGVETGAIATVDGPLPSPVQLPSATP